MEYVYGYITRSVENDIPVRLEELGRGTFEEVVVKANAESDHESLFDNSREVVIVTDRAVNNVSKEHPELDLIWSSNDDVEMMNGYLNLSPDKWNNMESRTRRLQLAPSVYFDLEGVLAKSLQGDDHYSSLEEMMDPASHYYRKLTPHPYMEALVSELQAEGRDVCVIAASDRFTMRDKIEWIQQYFPNIPSENIFFAPVGADKSNFVKDNASFSVLIDAYNKNLIQWEGKAVKSLEPGVAHEGRFPEIEITEDGSNYSPGHVKCSAMLIGDILDSSYDNSIDYFAAFSMYDPLIISVEKQLKEHEHDLTLDITKRIKEEAMMNSENTFTPEREAAIDQLIDDAITKRANDILDTVARKHNEIRKNGGTIGNYDFTTNVDHERFQFIFKNYCAMIKDSQRSGEPAPYDSFKSYFNAFVNEKLKHQDVRDPYFDKQNEYILRDFFLLSKDEKEYEICDVYAKKIGFNNADEFIVDGLGYVRGLYDTMELNIKLAEPMRFQATLNHDGNIYPLARDLFGRKMYTGDPKLGHGEVDVKSLSNILSKMTDEQRLDHFNNPLTYLIYQQGFSISELADVYISDKQSDSKFINSVKKELDNTDDRLITSTVTAFFTVDENSFEVLDTIAKRSEDGITISNEAMMQLHNVYDHRGTPIKLEKPFTFTGSMVSGTEVISPKDFDENWQGKASVAKADEITNINDSLLRADVNMTLGYIKKLANPTKQQTRD